MKKRPKALSTTEQQIVDGREAAAILKAAGGDCRACGQDDTIFARRVRQVVAEATAWFRTTDDKNLSTALRFIAALSEATALQEELKYRVKKAEHASERLHATAPGKTDTSSDA